MRSTSRLFLALALLGGIGGCSSSTSAKGVIGTYDVMITLMGVSDPDVLSIRAGVGGTILLNFTAGVTTDPTGINSDGIRATLNTPQMFTITAQPAHIDHSTGVLNGTLSGNGTIGVDGTLMATFNYTPQGGVLRDSDGGTLPIPDGGAGVLLVYTLSGHRQ